jgi:hypothetical protein
MLISLIYASNAKHLMNSEELLEILRVSRKNNEERSVTGLLLYKDGNFMQVLEGEEEDVLFIFRKVEKDTRHNAIIVISQEPIENRQFADWKMAFVNLDEDETIKKEPAYSMFLSDEFTAESYRANPQLVNIMLLTFKDKLR